MRPILLVLWRFSNFENPFTPYKDKEHEKNNICCIFCFHRARIEIRLSGNALPCSTIQEGEFYKFEQLPEYFNMRKVKQNLLNKAPISIQQSFERVTQLGTLKNSNTERKNALITDADKLLNDKFNNTLRDLSRRMTKSQKAGKTLH